MKKILDGESGSRGVAVDVEKKTVKVTHCWKKDKDAQRYELTFVYDFDVELSEVYRLAALWVNKDMQNRMRGDNAGEKDLGRYEKAPISVSGLYNPRERGPADPVKAAKRALERLSDEERAAILAQLTK